MLQSNYKIPVCISRYRTKDPPPFWVYYSTPLRECKEKSLGTRGTRLWRGFFAEPLCRFRHGFASRFFVHVILSEVEIRAE